MSDNEESAGRCEDKGARVVSWKIELDDDGDEPDGLLEPVLERSPPSAPERIPVAA